MLFSDLFAYLSNNTLSRAELSNSGKVRNIHYGDVLIKYGEVIVIEHTEIPYVADVSRLRKPDYLSTGDVVIADTAEDDTVGKAVEIINNSSVAVVSGLHTIPCRPKKRFVPSYLGYYVNSAPFHTQLHPYMQGIKVTSISKGNIGKTYISSPDLEEQQKITSLLNLLSSRIEKQRQLVEALKSYKRGALSKLFPQNGKSTPQYRFAGFTDLWEQRKLIDEVFSVDTGKSKFSLSNVGEYEVLGSTSVIGYDSSYDYEGEFILTARVGANAGELYRHSGKVKISDNTVFIQGKQLDFIYYALLNFDIKRLSFGTGQPLVKASELKNQIIRMPISEMERESVGAFFRHLDHLITLHQRKLSKFEDIKAGLLQQLFI